jgi:hypothetical protein
VYIGEHNLYLAVHLALLTVVSSYWAKAQLVRFVFSVPVTHSDDGISNGDNVHLQVDARLLVHCFMDFTQ